MNLSEFLSYKDKGHTHIPVYEEFVADLISPLYVFSNFYNQKNTFLFESAKSHETKGRYSIMTLACSKRYDFFDGEVHISAKENNDVKRVVNPYDYIDELTSKFSSPQIDDLPDFLGGLIGYFSYESFKFVEPKLKLKGSDIPYISLCEANELIIFDNYKGSFVIVCNQSEINEQSFTNAKRRISEIKNAIFSLQPSVKHNIKKSKDNINGTSNVDKKTFIEQVEYIKEQIADGEIMQAVLSKEVTFEGHYDPFTLYRALRLINPSPYMYFMNLGDFNIIGASPEILVQSKQGKVTIRPIAGTRKRGINSSEDLLNKIDLIEDDKEKAEHMMLVDLARNDLSKVSTVGSVNVDEMMIVEKYSHVMHMTSNVIGQKKDGSTAIDCMKAALPAGTLSGAPKIRAMEILAEQENRARGVYGGAVGYIGYNQTMDTAIVIRTALHNDASVKVGVGAGIVYDSVGSSEWLETEAKLAVFKEALKYE